MTQAISIPRRVVRVIHAGIGGAFLVLVPIAIAGDKNLRDAIAQGNWSRLRYLVFVLILCALSVVVALTVRRANSVLLIAFILLDIPLAKMVWDSKKLALLAPVLAVSLVCILIEMAKSMIVWRKQAA